MRLQQTQTRTHSRLGLSSVLTTLVPVVTAFRSSYVLWSTAWLDDVRSSPASHFWPNKWRSLCHQLRQLWKRSQPALASSSAFRCTCVSNNDRRLAAGNSGCRDHRFTRCREQCHSTLWQIFYSDTCLMGCRCTCAASPQVGYRHGMCTMIGTGISSLRQ